MEWEQCTASPQAPSQPSSTPFPLEPPSPAPHCGRTLIPASFHTPQHTPLRCLLTLMLSVLPTQVPCPVLDPPRTPSPGTTPSVIQALSQYLCPRPLPTTHSPAPHLSGAPAASSSSSSPCAFSDRLPRTSGLPLGSTHCTSTPGAMTLKTFMEGVVWAPMPPSPRDHAAVGPQRGCGAPGRAAWAPSSPLTPGGASSRTRRAALARGTPDLPAGSHRSSSGLPCSPPGYGRSGTWRSGPHFGTGTEGLELGSPS